MPPMEQAGRNQTAVLWEFQSYGPDGQPRVSSTPVELEVKWNDVRNQRLDKDGNTVGLDATVVVDRFIPIGSAIWLGELADWYGTGSNVVLNPDIMEVKTYNAGQDMKGRDTYYTIGLMRSKSLLPDRV